MSRRIAVISNIPPDFSTIMGANYFDDWNFDNAASLSLTGSLIDSITSTGSNGGVFSASGTARPTLVSNDINGKDAAQFDGVTDYMAVAASTATYKFLHNGSSATVIIVCKYNSDTGTTQALFGTNESTTPTVGYFLTQSYAGLVQNLVARGASGTRAVINTTPIGVLTSTNYNVILNKIDANNATAADRSETIVNSLTSYKLNVQTLNPSAANSTYNLHLGRTASSAAGYVSGNIARVIILNSHPTATQLSLIQKRLEYEYGIFPI